VPERGGAFVAHSRYLETIYAYGQIGYDGNSCERRIKFLDEMLDKNVLPWAWDYENYSGENEFMIGSLYVEDAENLKQLRNFDSQYNIRQSQQKR
jgi:hypothetical protein